MARMIPLHGPRDTDSYGEQTVYSLLKKHLSDEFTVIHSLPWLCAAVRQLDRRVAPTGEIDFIILHPELGVLALEVKSGRYRVEHSAFVHVRDGYVVDPVYQLRKGVHGLIRWLGVESTSQQVGYGYVFPDSDFGESIISSAMVDCSVSPPQKIFIDRAQMPKLCLRIVEIMQYWKSTMNYPSMGLKKLNRLIEVICPCYDGSPGWGGRVVYDNELWLRLTDEQNKIVNMVCNRQQALITGWPGTGKTLIGIEVARKMSSEGRRVLFVTYNSGLKAYIKNQLEGSKNCTVTTWHSLCNFARSQLGGARNDSQEWLRSLCHADLLAAVQKSLMGEYDLLVLDEAQALDSEWCETLFSWFSGKPIACFCDETQVFSFESQTTSLNKLIELLDGISPFFLSVVSRMPKAVTEHLIEAIPPNIQVSSPREFEDDSIEEIATTDPLAEVAYQLSRFHHQGVKEEHVIVLVDNLIGKTHMEYLYANQVNFKGVARFRGLESPIVIILGAESLDNAELFSAYSRATTMCIAIFDVKSPRWRRSGVFQKLFERHPANREKLAIEQDKLLVSNIVAENAAAVSVSLKTLNLAWSKNWGAWVVEFETPTDLAISWVDYLAFFMAAPVFFWFKNTLERIYRVRAYSDRIGVCISENPMRLKSCQACCCMTPHLVGVDELCVICSARFEDDRNGKLLYPGVVEDLKVYDNLVLPVGGVVVDVRKLRSQLPISVAAVGARLFAKRKKKREKILEMPLPEGAMLYRAALAFAQSRIAVCEKNELLIIKDIAKDIYQKYQCLSDVGIKQWQAALASAFATCLTKMYVRKVDKGVYAPVEDDYVPQRSLNAREQTTRYVF